MEPRSDSLQREILAMQQSHNNTHFIFDRGSEWNMRVDLTRSLCLERVKKILRPYTQEKLEEAYQRKKEKYTELMKTCREREKLKNVAVPSRSRLPKISYIVRMEDAIGNVKSWKGKGEAEERLSWWLWYCRDDMNWKPSADKYRFGNLYWPANQRM